MKYDIFDQNHYDETHEDCKFYDPVAKMCMKWHAKQKRLDKYPDLCVKFVKK